MVRQPIQVEIIIFRLIKGSYEYLLLKRIEARGGFWQPVTGGLEEGENINDAVIRELKEETGITKIKRIIDKVYEFTLKDKLPIKEYVFGVEIKNTPIKLDKNIYDEHEDYKWCSYSEAMKLLKWPGNKKGLTKLYKILGKN